MPSLSWKPGLLCLVAAALLGCDAADDGGSGERDAGATQRIAEGHDGGVVMPECRRCHAPDSGHYPDLLPYQCAGCHADNGPSRPLDHIDERCPTCHGSPHQPAEQFPSPESCLVCHAVSER